MEDRQALAACVGHAVWHHIDSYTVKIGWKFSGTTAMCGQRVEE